MLDISTLRKKIADNEEIIPAIIQELSITLSADEFIKNATDEQIMSAFTLASQRNLKIQKALHKYPLPKDWKTLGKFTGDNIIYHVERGLFAAGLIDQCVSEHSRDIRSMSGVLDFGCGVSRILRFLSEYRPGPTYRGSEVYKAVIDWGKENMKDIQYIHHGPQPPLDLPDDSLDLIYAWSIFSHLDEPTCTAWILELRKKLKKDGLLIVSVQGITLLNRLLNEEDIRHAVKLGKEGTAQLIESFHEQGFIFKNAYDADSLDSGGLDSQTFGLAYISKKYIQQEWGKLFNVLEIKEGIIQRYQDIVILEKTSS